MLAFHLKATCFMSCRIAQKQCCVSYLKENSCIAGMVAAREGDLCGPDESDTCGGSFYKARYFAETFVRRFLTPIYLKALHFKWLTMGYVSLQKILDTE